jgi:hypothetical protein
VPKVLILWQLVARANSLGIIKTTQLAIFQNKELTMRYRIYLINFDYYLQDDFDTEAAAIQHGKSKGFEFRVDHGKTPVASWSPISGLRTGLNKVYEFVVTDCDFNRANYPDLIGKRFKNPPSYAAVMEVEKE